MTETQRIASELETMIGHVIPLGTDDEMLRDLVTFAERAQKIVGEHGRLAYAIGWAKATLAYRSRPDHVSEAISLLACAIKEVYRYEAGLLVSFVVSGTEKKVTLISRGLAQYVN